jgi:hypothetical protein
MLTAWRRHREIKASALSVPGFIASSFLIEGLRTFVTFSIWEDDSAIELFEAAAIAQHPAAVRWAGRQSTERWSVMARDLTVSRSSRVWTS